MQLRNTSKQYGLIAKSLHWIMALLIITAWMIGYYAVDLPNTNLQKMKLFDLHKSVGMVILMLVIIRLSWRLYNNAPESAVHSKLLRIAANIVHYLLYLFMFIQPISGWLMSSAAGYIPTLFGWYTFPALVAKDPAMVEVYVTIHNTSAQILLWLFILHVSAALTHHFVFKDNTLRRMTIE